MNTLNSKTKKYNTDYNNPAGNWPSEIGYRPDRYPRIRISQQAYEKIAWCAQETHSTMNEISTKLIDFAVEHLKHREEQVVVTKFYLGDQEV